MPSPTDHTDILLKEYEVAQGAINAQNQTAWQIGSIFVVASLAILAFAGQELFRSGVVPSVESFLLLSGLALVSWGTLYLWYLAYRRWGTFVEITHRRLHEIEKELGIWKNRDIEIVDTIIQGREADSPISSEEDAAHMAAVITWASRLNRRRRLTARSIDIAIRGIVALVLFGWLGILVFHMPDYLVPINRWYLVIVSILIPLAWFYYPRIRARWIP